MSSASDPAVHPPQLGGRLHPAAVLTWSLQQGVGLVVLLVLGGTGRWGWLFPVVGVVVTVLAAVVRYRRFTWRLEPGGLVIQQGLIQRSRRVIPLDRVQSVDLVRPLRHRLLGVTQVRVEAIGGRDSEGLLEAIDLATAQALRTALSGRRAPAVGDLDPDPDARPHPTGAGTGPGAGGREGVLLARVRPRDLVVAGLTGGRVGVLAVLLGGAQQIAGDRIDRAFRLVPVDAGILVLALLVALAAVVVFVLSVIATVLTHWDFTLTGDGPDLRIAQGLLEQRAETIPIRRIQSVRIEQNLLRRLLGLAAVKADLAGRAGQDGAQTGLLLPIAPVAHASWLVEQLLQQIGGQVPAGSPVTALLQPADPRSRRRWLLRGLAVAVPAAVAGGVAIPVLGLPVWTPLVTAAIGAALGVPLLLASWRALGWADLDGVLVAQTGVLIRRRVHVPVARVQVMAVTSSPFQHRLGLADVSIGIARSGGWAGPQMLELDRDAAHALTASTVHDAVARSRRPVPSPNRDLPPSPVPAPTSTVPAPPPAVHHPTD